MKRPPATVSAHRALAVAAAGVALGLTALVFDAAPLLVVAVALTALGVVTPAWVWLAARGARVHRELQADRVIEGEQFQAALEVQRAWVGLARIHVIDPFTGARFDAWAAPDAVRERRRASIHVLATLSRRGLHRLAPPSLVVADPLELVTLHAPGGDHGQEVLVLPATEPVRWTVPGLARRLARPDGAESSDAFAAADIDGLRPYRVGTPASRIHWPAVARGAGLMERRLRAEGDTRPLVVLDTRCAAADAASGLLVDAAVRAAASLVLELARDGGCGLLLPGDQRPTTVDPELIAWPAAHARLALVQGGPDVRPPGLGPGSARRPGATIYVAAAPGERIGGGLLSGGPAMLVVPEPALVDGGVGGSVSMRGSMQAALSVSGCQGFLLGAGRRVAVSRAPERVG